MQIHNALKTTKNMIQILSKREQCTIFKWTPIQKFCACKLFVSVSNIWSLYSYLNIQKYVKWNEMAKFDTFCRERWKMLQSIKRTFSNILHVDRRKPGYLILLSECCARILHYFICMTWREHDTICSIIMIRMRSKLKGGRG